MSPLRSHYVTGTPDGKRPGRVVVATSDFAYSLAGSPTKPSPTTKGIPGITCSCRCNSNRRVAEVPSCMAWLQRLHRGVGVVRRATRQRGWLLSGSCLGTTAACFGTFSCRQLVVDTGIHSKGWTREQVVEFMRKSGAVDEPTIQSETDRYIAWPAQALSYKIGSAESFANCAIALKKSWDQSSTSAPSTTKCWTAEHSRSIFSKPYGQMDCRTKIKVTKCKRKALECSRALGFPIRRATVLPEPTSARLLCERLLACSQVAL